MSTKKVKNRLHLLKKSKTTLTFVEVSVLSYLFYQNNTFHDLHRSCSKGTETAKRFPGPRRHPRTKPKSPVSPSTCPFPPFRPPNFYPQPFVLQRRWFVSLISVFL